MATSEFADMVADYINGHLPPEQANRLEREMQRNPALAEQVQFERTLQASVRASVPRQSPVLPHFAPLRARIEARNTSWWHGMSMSPRWWVPAVSSLVILFAAVSYVRDVPQQANSFQTLSDRVQSPAGPLLRIVATDGTSTEMLRHLVHEYGLEPVQWHPQALAVDVKVAAAQDAAELHKRLIRDARVRHVIGKGVDTVDQGVEP